MGLRRFAPPTQRFIWLFVAGLVLQGGTLWLRGTSDVLIFKSWALSAVTHGVFEAYSPPVPARASVAEIPFVAPDYPPMAVYILSAAAHVALWIDPDLNARSRLLTIIVKSAILAARLTAFAVVLWVAVSLVNDPRRGWASALVMWLNPALVLNGPALGYLDPLCWAPGLAAVALAWGGRPILAGIALAVTVAIKPQGIFYILPVVAALWHRPGHLKAAVLAAVTSGVAIGGPFLVFGRPGDFFDAMAVNASEDLLSGNAVNAWWLVTAAWRAIALGAEALTTRPLWLSLSEFTTIVGVNPRLWAAALVVGLWGLAFWRVRQDARPVQVAALGALIVHVYFTFAVNVHENHLVHAVPLAALAAMLDRRYWSVYIGLSALVTLNMVLFYGIGRDFAVPVTPLLLPVSTLASLAGLALLAHHARVFHHITSVRPRLESVAPIPQTSDRPQRYRGPAR